MDSKNATSRWQLDIGIFKDLCHIFERTADNANCYSIGFVVLPEY